MTTIMRMGGLKVDRHQETPRAERKNSGAREQDAWEGQEERRRRKTEGTAERKEEIPGMRAHLQGRYEGRSHKVVLGHASRCAL